MTPTEKGAFCQKCAKQVIDFTSKSNAEIKAVFMEMAGQQVCGKIRNTQMDSFNLEAKASQLNSSRAFQSRMVFSLVVVFGLSLFSCTTEKEKKTILKMQETIAQTLAQPEATPVIETLPIEQKVMIAEEAHLVRCGIQSKRADYDVMATREPLEEKNQMHEKIEYEMLGGMSYRFADFEMLEPVSTPVVEYDENGAAIPAEFNSKAFPNPASTSTTLEIGLPADDLVEISLYDLNGQFIRYVFSGNLKRGTHTYPVDLIDLPAGMYLFITHSKNYSGTTRFVKV